MFRLLFEASEAYRNPTGIGRFARALINELVHNAYDVETFFAPHDYNQRQHAQTQRTLLNRITNFSEHLSLTQWQAYNSARRHKVDVFFSPSFFSPLLSSIPTVVTFHDLNYHEQPQLTDRFWGTYARRMMPIFARRAAALVTTTETVKRSVCEYFALPHDKVHAVPMGIDPKFRVSEVSEQLHLVREKYQLNEPFALYVGAWYKTKNLPVLLHAFAPLKDATLVITGHATTPEQQEIPELAHKLGVRVRFVGRVSDDELVALYNMAHVVVQPSLYEGFGMPVIEAMACGAPVIASDIDVLQEVAGDAAQFFPRHDPASLSHLLSAALNSPERNPQQSQKSLQRASQYTWPLAVQKLIPIWRGVANLS